MAWERGVSGLGGGGDISTPHDSTQGHAEPRPTIHQLPLSSIYKHNGTFQWSDGTRFTPDPLCLEHNILRLYFFAYLTINNLCLGQTPSFRLLACDLFHTILQVKNKIKIFAGKST